MLTVRLSKDLESRLLAQAESEHAPKSEIVKRAIQEYIETRESQKSSYELGKHLFGCFDSGRTDLSKNYKKVLKEKLHAKHHR